MSQETLFEQAGGQEGLRAVVADFYDHVFDDVMIGYLFWGVDKAQIIEREVEFAARMLGARDVSYQGRPLRQAHGPHRILGGHFDRRLQLLREAMERHGLPPEVRRAWEEHTRSLRSQITHDVEASCTHLPDA